MDNLRDLTSGAEDIGPSSEMDVIARFVPVAGLDVADVGCGDGRFARQLVERGARVLGVEPDPIQAEKNRAAEPVPGLTFVEAPGQALPIEDGSMDGVFFSYSLHHMPPEHMDGALLEAIRVLKPEGGFICAVEPLLTGTMEPVYQPFHDESEMRILAYDALGRVAAPRFAEAQELRYSESVPYDDFGTFLEEMTGTTYCDFPRERVDTPEVRAAFEVGRSGDSYLFDQHIRVNFYRGPSR